MSTVTGRLFVAKDFVKMLRHKEETGGIVERRLHPSLGVVYEVRYLPPVEPVTIPQELKA